MCDVEGVAANYVRAADVAALIGWLAILESELKLGQVPQRLAVRFRDRLVREGLLRPDSPAETFRHAIADLTDRLRYAVGEPSLLVA